MNIDDKITDLIIENFDIFHNIHPNVISLIGITCNVILFLIINHENIENYSSILSVCTIIRFLSDCLDGAVARKYNKTSKLGHMLDTVSDMMFMFLMINMFIVKYSLSKMFYCVGVLIILYLHFCHQIFSTHENMKKSKNGILDKLTNFLTNNSVITHISFLLIVVFL